MQPSLPSLQQFDHLLILEPSTQPMRSPIDVPKTRSTFPRMANSCSLYTWPRPVRCSPIRSVTGVINELHLIRRIGGHGLSSGLPMKNRTLTYSYLLASRTVVENRSWRDAARVIGDTLARTRQDPTDDMPWSSSRVYLVA